MTLTIDDVAHLLAVERRRSVIAELAEESPLRMTTLVDRIAEDNRTATMAALSQKDVPKLVDCGVATYTDDGSIGRGEAFDELQNAMSALEDSVSDPELVTDGGQPNPLAAQLDMLDGIAADLDDSGCGMTADQIGCVVQELRDLDAVDLLTFLESEIEDPGVLYHVRQAASKHQAQRQLAEAER
jgi:hypothetical protein